MPEIYLSSDHHFYHGNIIKYCNRPFQSIDEMNSVMIENWNKVVKTGDSVYYLGDFAFAPYEKILPIFKSLNGNKMLAAVGNHDSGAIKRLPWITTVTKNLNFPYKDEWHYFSHYPTDVINEADTKKFKHKYYFHGHCHNNGGIHRNKIDVGVDGWNYSPVSIDILIQKIKDTPCI